MNEKTGAAEQSTSDRPGAPGRASQRKWSQEDEQDLQEGGSPAWQGEEDEQNHRGRKAWEVPESGRGPAPSSLDLLAAGRALGCLPRWRGVRSAGPEELEVAGEGEMAG